MNNEQEANAQNEIFAERELSSLFWTNWSDSSLIPSKVATEITPRRCAYILSSQPYRAMKIGWQGCSGRSLLSTWAINLGTIEKSSTDDSLSRCMLILSSTYYLVFISDHRFPQGPLNCSRSFQTSSATRAPDTIERPFSICNIIEAVTLFLSEPYIRRLRLLRLEPNPN